MTETLARLKADAAEIIGRYPRARSALLPLLHLVQAEEGYVSEDGIKFCAETLGITETEVRRRGDLLHDVQAQPAAEYQVGRLHEHDVRDHGRRPDLRRARRSTWAARTRHGDGHHDIKSPDGKVAVERVECNAACDYAPVVMVNWEFFDNQTPESAKKLVDDLRAGDARRADPGPEPAVHLEAGQPDPRRVRRRPGRRGPVGRARQPGRARSSPRSAAGRRRSRRPQA